MPIKCFKLPIAFNDFDLLWRSQHRHTVQNESDSYFLSKVSVDILCEQDYEQNVFPQLCRVLRAGLAEKQQQQNTRKLF